MDTTTNGSELNVLFVLGNTLCMLGYPRTTQVDENPPYIRGVLDHTTLAMRHFEVQQADAFIHAMHKLPKDRFYWLLDTLHSNRVIAQNHSAMSEYLTLQECNLMEAFETRVNLELRQILGIA